MWYIVVTIVTIIGIIAIRAEGRKAIEHFQNVVDEVKRERRN
jgi:hypothetical protein